MSEAIDKLVAELVTDLAMAGHMPSDLDAAVHDAAAERATAINNEGLTAQVRFLLQGSDHSWKPADIRHAARAGMPVKKLDAI